MSIDHRQFEQRKQDHIALALMKDNQTDDLHQWDQHQLIHDALPDFNFEDINIQSIRFGHPVANPFFVSSMTAGHSDAGKINHHLMAACAESHWAMGVGSQRRELTDPNAAKEWSKIRQQHPNVVLFSNLGIAQLINTPLAQIQRLMESIQAQALIIHLNALQECIQPEGTPQFKGSWHALSQLVKHLKMPIIIKETGCGFSKQTLQRLNDVGVTAVDVSGLGGTHWGRIEGHRAQHHRIKQTASKTFQNWGIDTLQSIKNANDINPSYEIWGSGGVRHGLDAAKLLALKASSVGFAKPLLKAALSATDEVLTIMSTIEYELKVAMFCTGSRVLKDLQGKLCQ